MARRMRPSPEAIKTRYFVRALKRISSVLVWAFILFLIVMGIVWAAPKVWHIVFP